MKIFHAIALSLAALALPATFGGCASNDPNGTSSGTTKPVCIVGQNSACLCASGYVGTKECLASEGQYTECRLGPTACPTGAPDSGPAAGPEEQCPGKAVGVSANATTIKGSLTKAVAELKGESACAALEGNVDHVYKLVSTATGALKIDQKGPYKAALYVRKGDCTGGKQLRCDPNGPASFSVNVVAGRDYYLVVKGVGSTGAGDYELSLQVTPGGFCGDGQVKDQEVCDDENNDAMDGCAAGCNEIEGIADSANSCPGQQVVIPVAKVVKISNGNTTQGAKRNIQRLSTACDISASDVNFSNDRLYSVTPRQSGTLTVEQTAGNFNVILAGLIGCDLANPVLGQVNGKAACGNDCGSNQFPPTCSEKFTMAVEANKTYAVVVDGRGTSSDVGTYELQMSVK
jgi:cysteine-rich repeat protein